MKQTYGVIGTQTTAPPEIEVCFDTVYVRNNIKRIMIEHRNRPNKEAWCYDETQYEIREYITFIFDLEKRQNNAEPFVERMKTAAEVYEESKMKSDISLDNLKSLRIMKLKEECTNAIFAGFTSASTEYSFGFNDLDQTNFTQQMLLIVASTDTYTDPILWKTLEGTIVTLNATQFQSIVHEAEQHKRAEQSKYWNLESQILAANTIEEVDSILW